MEEPENGIHPAKISAMVDILRRLAVDPRFAPGDDNPLRQVIVNTHSPELVRAQDQDDLLIAWPVAYQVDGKELMGVEFYPMAGGWRVRSGEPHATPFSVASYLADPKKSPVWQSLKLFDEFNF